MSDLIKARIWLRPGKILATTI